MSIPDGYETQGLVPPETDDEPRFDEAFLDALRGQHSWLRHADGTRTRLPVTRWLGTSDNRDDRAFDRYVARLCSGPTVDLGCGPGRLVRELIDHGVAALGVDRSAHAVSMTRRRGGVALRRSMFETIPAEGGWYHALLIDGNIGIGGDPYRTVSRAAQLVADGGSVVVELEHGLPSVWTGTVRVESRSMIGPWFPWARAGVGAAREIAERAGLRLGTAHVISGRHLVEMVRDAMHTRANTTRVSPAVTSGAPRIGVVAPRLTVHPSATSDQNAAPIRMPLRRAP